VLSKVFLHGTPEELNEIKFTMKLGKEYADVQELPWLIAAFWL